MLKVQNIELNVMSMLLQKLKDYQQLAKLNLSLLVVFSSVVGYLIIPGLEFNALTTFYLLLGGLLVTIAANASNELIEIETDKLMKRTATRPLPDNRMGQIEAIAFIIVALVSGLLILLIKFNFLSAILSLISYAIYVFIYTPMKKVSPIAVLVGAIPGALPCLIGWVAGTGSMWSVAAWTLFIIQFLWQFPHFWSIAWVAHEDYEKAGMKMLPHGKKEGNDTGFKCMMYSAVLITTCMLPAIVGFGKVFSPICIALAGVWMMCNSYLFYKDNSDANARKVMFASFLYLPVILLSLLIDKFIF
jgi:protoheme IX farnesyltransferase